MLSPADFAHRPNPNGTVDSICRVCYQTVATYFWEADLEKSEHEHVCKTCDLQRFQRKEFEIDDCNFVMILWPSETRHSLFNARSLK